MADLISASSPVAGREAAVADVADVGNR